MTDGAGGRVMVKFPYRIGGLDGYRSDEGPTYDGGSFSGGGPRSNRSVAVRLLTPMGRPATVELDLCDASHGCTVTLDPQTARGIAEALVVAAEKAEAEMAHWREVLDRQRAELEALRLRDLEGRAGMEQG